MSDLTFADVARFDVTVSTESDGTAILVDAFGNEAWQATDLFLVIVRSPSHTQIGAAFGDSADEAQDAALWMTSKHEDQPLTADLIRPLGRIAPVDDLLIDALAGAL